MGSVTLSEAGGLALQAPEQPEFLEVPPRDFLLVTGTGGPETVEFTAAADLLLVVSHSIVRAVGLPPGTDGRGAPLEALWTSTPNPLAFDPARRDRSGLSWTLMVRQPDQVPDEVQAEAIAAAARDLGPEAVAKLRPWRFEEGPSVQVVHRGPVNEQGPTIARLHQYVAESGWRLRGRHHEIFLTDPRRSAPDRMQTLLRHPVC